jgi:hypothetical protein
MKKKGLNKKLVLNKETISNLTPGEMDTARGGDLSFIDCWLTKVTKALSCPGTCPKPDPETQS